MKKANILKKNFFFDFKGGKEIDWELEKFSFILKDQHNIMEDIIENDHIKSTNEHRNRFKQEQQTYLCKMMMAVTLMIQILAI